MSTIGEDIVKAINKEDAAPPPPPMPVTDATRRVRDLIAASVDYDRQKYELETRLEQVKAAQFKLLHEDIPIAMDTAGLAGKNTFAPDPVNGLPQIEVNLKPYYKASISANWPEERREASFMHLTEIGAGDLIETEVTVSFPREVRSIALQFVRTVQEMFSTSIVKPGIRIDESIPWARLTKWLRERSEKVTVPATTLEHIGGFVGRVVDIKVVQEKEPK